MSCDFVCIHLTCWTWFNYHLCSLLSPSYLLTIKWLLFARSLLKSLIMLFKPPATNSLRHVLLLEKRLLRLAGTCATGNYLQEFLTTAVRDSWLSVVTQGADAIEGKKPVDCRVRGIENTKVIVNWRYLQDDLKFIYTTSVRLWKGIAKTNIWCDMMRYN